MIYYCYYICFIICLIICFLQIHNVEHFESFVHVLVNQPIFGKIILNEQDDFKVFQVLSNKILDFKPIPGDRITLTKQPYEIENGKYRVLQIDKHNMLLSNAFPCIFSTNFKIVLKVKSTFQVENINKLHFEKFLKLYDAIFFIDYKQLGHIIDIDLKKGFKKFVITIHVFDDNDPLKYSCFAKPHFHSKEICEENDAIWDRPCVKNSDCPFFNIQKGYRWGCFNGGFCELPPHVERAGFRKYFI